MAADDGLKEPVVVTALGINAASLPAVFSQAYQYYVLSQSTDFVNVAGKANEAGQGAYDAQVKNDEQDVELEDHEQRITANTAAIGLIVVRLTTAEGKIIVLRSDVDYLLDEVIDIQAELVTVDGRLDVVETDIDNLQTDYVSKSAVTPQNLASPLNVTTSYSVGGTVVVRARVTGFTAMTGTALKTALNADYTETGSATYSPAQMTQIFSIHRETRQRLKAIEDALRTHGLIN